MIERPWEIEAPSLAITLRWGDVALHTAHLDPPRAFFLGGLGADCVLPESAVGAGRVPLILVERGAVYLVLHPAMDPDGTITTPGRGDRAVAALARAGMAEASQEVPGGFLIELVPGMTAALTIGAFTIAIALETKAACAVAGHFYVSRRMVPFQLGSAVLHLALMGAALTPAEPRLDRNETSDEQIYYMQQVFQTIAAKEEAELEDGEGYAPPERPRWSGYSAPVFSNDRYLDYAQRRAPRSRSSAASARPEEFLEGFDYRYAGPERGAATPFVVHLAAAPSPFDAGHHLLRVGVQGRRSAATGRAADRELDILAVDVKITIDFNPSVVRSYRLLGHEPSGDRIDVGEIDAGDSVTVVYDVVLASTASSPVTVRIQHLAPFGRGAQRESVFSLSPRAISPSLDAAPASLRLAVAVTGFAEILRKSPDADAWRLADVERLARAEGDGDTPARELMILVHAARSLDDAHALMRWSGRVADASLMGF